MHLTSHVSGRKKNLSVPVARRVVLWQDLSNKSLYETTIGQNKLFVTRCSQPDALLDSAFYGKICQTICFMRQPLDNSSQDVSDKIFYETTVGRHTVLSQDVSSRIF